MKPNFLIAFSLLLLAFGISARADQPTRAEFAAAMSNVKEGMKADEVVKLLGKPDDILTQRDPGGNFYNPTSEIWAYGTDGHHSFATLGTVFMEDGKAHGVCGGNGTPPDPAMFAETDLRKLLRLIASTTGRESNNPLRLIQAVNTLQPLGKEKALAAIGEYLRVAPEYNNDEGLSVFFILRLLFEVPEDTGFMPRMNVGAPDPEEPANHKLLPLFPLALVNDIPLDLVFGYSLAGEAERPETHLEYFRKNGKLRQHPLLPGNDPLFSLAMLEQSPQWIYPQKSGGTYDDWGKRYLAEQLLSLIDTVYRIEPDRHGDRLSPYHFDQKRWDTIVKEVAALKIKWDPARNIYVFPDGHFLPEVKSPVYVRQIWDLPALDVKAELIIERMDKDYISIKLLHPGFPGRPVPESVVAVRSAGVNGRELAQFKIPYSPGEDIYRISGDEEKLPAGDSVQAEIVIGDKTTKSPVLTP